MPTPLIVIQSELSPAPVARSSPEQIFLPTPAPSPQQLSLPSPVPSPMSTIGGVGVQDTQCGMGMGAMDMYMGNDMHAAEYTHNNSLGSSLPSFLLSVETHVLLSLIADVALGPYDAMYPQALSVNLYSPFYDHHHTHPHDPFFPHDILVTYSGDMNVGSTSHLDYYSLTGSMDSLSGSSSPPDAEFAGLSSEWDELMVLSPLPISSLTEPVGSGSSSSSSSQYSTPSPATPAHLSSPSSPSAQYATVDPVALQQSEVSWTMEESKGLLEFDALNQVVVDQAYY